MKVNLQFLLICAKKSSSHQVFVALENDDLPQIQLNDAMDLEKDLDRLIFQVSNTSREWLTIYGPFIRVRGDSLNLVYFSFVPEKIGPITWVDASNLSDELKIIFNSCVRRQY